MPNYTELLKHLEERSAVKSEGYGTLLRTNNGRHGAVDAYQELLDAVMFWRQYIDDQFWLGLSTSPVKVSDRFWVDPEPPPKINYGSVVLDYVKQDLSLEEGLSLIEPTTLTNNRLVVMYAKLIALTEEVRVEIENSKTKIQLSGDL